MQNRKYLTRPRFGLNHLREHKFKHSFQDTLNPFCSCGIDNETNMHFFYCPLFTSQRRTLILTVIVFWHILMIRYWLYSSFWQSFFRYICKPLILNATMKYIISVNIFQESPFLVFYKFLFCYFFISLAFFLYPYVFFT